MTKIFILNRSCVVASSRPRAPVAMSLCEVACVIADAERVSSDFPIVTRKSSKVNSD